MSEDATKYEQYKRRLLNVGIIAAGIIIFGALFFIVEGANKMFSLYEKLVPTSEIVIDTTATMETVRVFDEVSIVGTVHAYVPEGRVATAIRVRATVAPLTDAPDSRHDDALLLAGRISSLYLPHPMRIFRLNTTRQDPEKNDFEDLCAIPDLAAGMLSEIATRLAKEGKWENRTSKILESNLPMKAEVISDWFWDTQMRLRKTFISIDVEGSQFSVRRVSQLESAPC